MTAAHPRRETGFLARDTRQGHRTEYPADFPVTLSKAGESFTVAVRQSVRAADLLALERCTSPCLLAREDGDCICRCGGEFHGALEDAEVTIDPAAWHSKAVIRAVHTDHAAVSLIGRHELRALPLTGPAHELRLKVAMLAFDCEAPEAARRLGLSRRTARRVASPRTAQGTA